MGNQDVDNRIGIVHKVVGIQLELLELRVLSNQVFNRIFKASNDRFERLTVWWLLDVEDHIVVNSKFLGDRQGIFGRASMGVVIDRDVRHLVSPVAVLDSRSRLNRTHWFGSVPPSRSG